jgi:nitrous oxidase accessory protein NosD
MWNNDNEGNYWSNYNGTDINHDGIGDTPIGIFQSQQDQAHIIWEYQTLEKDNYPLMKPFTPSLPKT